MTERDLATGGIDTTTPNVARIYDYLLGGCFLQAHTSRRARYRLILPNGPAAGPGPCRIQLRDGVGVGRRLRRSCIELACPAVRVLTMGNQAYASLGPILPVYAPSTEWILMVRCFKKDIWALVIPQVANYAQEP